MKVNTDNKVNRVYGGLLGQYKGNKCIIHTAFEFMNQSSDDQMTNFDLSYIEERRKLIEQLYPNLEIVGFFSTNTTPISVDIDKEAIKVMEYLGVVTPIQIVLGTDLTNVDELPIASFKIDKNTKNITKIEHLLESNESERVCLETVTKSGDLQNNETALIQNMQTIKNAIGVLKSNMNLIKNSINDPKFQNDPHYLLLLNEIIYNYPDASNSDHLNFLRSREEETLILNNLCASSINISLQGKIDSYRILDEKKYNR
jgi:hypothetical protein